MIPIGLPSLEFVLIRLAYLAATLVWVVWAVRLAFRQKARSRLRTWRGPLFLLLSGVAFYTLWSIYAASRELAAHAAERQVNYYPVLQQDQRLGGIDMPAGTRLHLALPRQLDAFKQAEFPHPVTIAGVEALLAERYLSIQTDEAYRTSGFTPQNLRLTGAGVSPQAGWLCDASSVIVFETHPDGTPKAFQSCKAAPGNQIEGAALPSGSEIIASEGRLFLDGRPGLDRWLIHLPENGVFPLQGAEQRGGAVLLNAERKVIEQIPQ